MDMIITGVVAGLGVLGLGYVLRPTITRLMDTFGPGVVPRPLLNKSERLLHSALWIALSEINRTDLYLLTQVSYGEFLEAADRTTRARFNSKRADFVIADVNFLPKVVIEYQGSGHFGSTWLSLQDAKARDATKRSILRRAGIPLIEFHEGFTLAEVRAQLQDALKAPKRRVEIKRVKPPVRHRQGQQTIKTVH